MVGTSTSAHRAEHMPRHAFFASQILIPRAYKAGGVDNRHDVALVKLSQRVPRALFRAARLAGGAERPRGNEALVAGFGALGEGMKMAAKLKIAKLQVLNHRQCEQREMQPYRKYLRSELQLCAVSMGWPFRGVTDTCHGDSGGPLFEMRRGRLVQFGVTSFGSSVCGQPGAVAWYTNVATYRKMILDTITNGKGKWRRFA